MLDILSTNTDLLWAALISAIVSAAVSYFLRKRELRHKLAAEYEYEQRKKLRDLIGRYHGRLIHAANILNQRLWNFYGHSHEGWLDAGGRYAHAGYYLRSFAYRFLSVHSLVRQFESEAIYVDQRIAKKADFRFLNYLTALGWVMTDVALFKGFPYDTNLQADHFFGDNLRIYCDACIKNGQFLAPEAFRQLVENDRTLDPVFAYFDGLDQSEGRLRWDRLVAFHLILMAFLNSFGYETQHTGRAKITAVAQRIRHPEVISNLLAWLPRLGLRGRDNKLLVAACQGARQSPLPPGAA